MRGIDLCLMTVYVTNVLALTLIIQACGHQDSVVLQHNSCQIARSLLNLVKYLSCVTASISLHRSIGQC